MFSRSLSLRIFPREEGIRIKTKSHLILQDEKFVQRTEVQILTVVSESLAPVLEIAIKNERERD